MLSTFRYSNLSQFVLCRFHLILKFLTSISAILPVGLPYLLLCIPNVFRLPVLLLESAVWMVSSVEFISTGCATWFLVGASQVLTQVDVSFPIEFLHWCFFFLNSFRRWMLGLDCGQLVAEKNALPNLERRLPCHEPICCWYPAIIHLWNESGHLCCVLWKMHGGK